MIASGQHRDFFVSYTSADRAWAEWIAWELEQAGFTVTIQAWDFRPGQNFVTKMDEALAACERVLMVLSPNYLDSRFGGDEWKGAYAAKKDALLPVRVRECEPPPLLKPVVYIDLVDKPDAEARQLLLSGVQKGRVKPSGQPPYPKRHPGVLPRVFNVPQLRNANFTGRDCELDALRSGFITPIDGLPGVGKTSLAIEYAYRFASDYEVVWWVEAETLITLSGLALELGLAPPDTAEPALSTLALQWLNHNSGWLLIFDNAPDLKACQPWLPRAGGKVLITSRDPNWRKLASPLHVDALPRQDAIALLVKHSGKIDAAQADQLCDALGDLPLAIAMAGAYIEENAISIDADRTRYLHDGLEPVAAVFETAFAKLDAAAIEVLGLICFFAPDRIPRKLLGDSGDAGVRCLRKYSLIQAGEEQVSIHRLVQQIARDRLEEAERKRFAKLAVERVGDLFPSDLENAPETWPLAAGVLPHSLTAHFAQELVADLGSAAKLSKHAGLNETWRRSQEAVDLLNCVLEIARDAYNVGLDWQAQGDLAQTMSHTQSALEIDEKNAGADHHEVAATPTTRRDPERPGRTPGRT